MKGKRGTSGAPVDVPRVFGPLLRYVYFTNLWRSIKRALVYEGNFRRIRETVGSHTSQLDDIARFLIDALNLPLNRHLVSDYIRVHDKVEYFAGETPAFYDPKDLTQPTTETKRERERLARDRMEEQWGHIHPELIQLIDAYEAQKDQESRFVRALDKLLATLNVYQEGGSSNRKARVTRAEHDKVKGPVMALDPTIAELYRILSRELDGSTQRGMGIFFGENPYLDEFAQRTRSSQRQ